MNKLLNISQGRNEIIVIAIFSSRSKYPVYSSSHDPMQNKYATKT